MFHLGQAIKASKQRQAVNESDAKVLDESELKPKIDNLRVSKSEESATEDCESVNNEPKDFEADEVKAGDIDWGALSVPDGSSSANIMPDATQPINLPNQPPYQVGGASTTEATVITNEKSAFNVSGGNGKCQDVTENADLFEIPCPKSQQNEIKITDPEKVMISKERYFSKLSLTQVIDSIVNLHYSSNETNNKMKLKSISEGYKSEVIESKDFEADVVKAGVIDWAEFRNPDGSSSQKRSKTAQPVNLFNQPPDETAGPSTTKATVINNEKTASNVSGRNVKHQDVSDNADLFKVPYPKSQQNPDYEIKSPDPEVMISKERFSKLSLKRVIDSIVGLHKFSNEINKKLRLESVLEDYESYVNEPHDFEANVVKAGVIDWAALSIPDGSSSTNIKHVSTQPINLANKPPEQVSGTSTTEATVITNASERNVKYQDSSKDPELFEKPSPKNPLSPTYELELLDYEEGRIYRERFSKLYSEGVEDPTVESTKSTNKTKELKPGVYKVNLKNPQVNVEAGSSKSVPSGESSGGDSSWTESTDLRRLGADVLKFKQIRLNMLQSMETGLVQLLLDMTDMLKNVEVINETFDDTRIRPPLEEDKLQSENETLRKFMNVAVNIVKYSDEILNGLKEKTHMLMAAVTASSADIDECVNKYVNALSNYAKKYSAEKGTSEDTSTPCTNSNSKVSNAPEDATMADEISVRDIEEDFASGNESSSEGSTGQEADIIGEDGSATEVSDDDSIVVDPVEDF